MKQYFVFSYADYDACGGMNDFSGAFDTFKDAEAHGEKLFNEWYQIIDVRNPHRVYQRRTRNQRAAWTRFNGTADVLKGEWTDNKERHND